MDLTEINTVGFGFSDASFTSFFFLGGGGGRHLGLEMMSTSELGVEPCICNFRPDTWFSFTVDKDSL